MELTKEQREELRGDWVKALRSGEYKQCRRALEIPGVGNCCLGVLCRVFDKKFPAVIKIAPLPSRIAFDGHTDVLPESVREAAGLSSARGIFVSGNGKSMGLSALNDGDKSFAEIASVIESRPEALFND